MQQQQIIVIGDSHIGLGEGQEKPIVAWLDRLGNRAPQALYLNGDLFHYLIAHPKFRTTSVDRVFERFRKLRDAGTKIHYVEGNRDFFLKGSFVESSVTDVATEYSVAVAQKRYLIVHGDMINDRDWPYRFWRRASKNPLSRLGLELIPRRTAKGFVDSIERRLAQSNFKHKTTLPIELMTKYAIKRAADGHTDVVFGHFHHKLVLPTSGATVTILPPWYETGEAMVIDPQSGSFAFEQI